MRAGRPGGLETSSEHKPAESCCWLLFLGSKHRGKALAVGKLPAARLSCLPGRCALGKGLAGTAPSHRETGCCRSTRTFGEGLCSPKSHGGNTCEWDIQPCIGANARAALNGAQHPDRSPRASLLARVCRGLARIHPSSIQLRSSLQRGSQLPPQPSSPAAALLPRAVKSQRG